MTSPPTLRHLAEAATPGPWTSTGLKYGSIYIFGPDSAMVADRHEENDEPRAIVRMRGAGAGLPQEANAEFIAAANPTAVLALLDERDALERERDEAVSYMPTEPPAHGAPRLILNAYGRRCYDAGREAEQDAHAQQIATLREQLADEVEDGKQSAIAMNEENDRHIARIAELEGELRTVDLVLGNRTALDSQPTRDAKIAACIKVAQANDPKGELAKALSDLAHLKRELQFTTEANAVLRRERGGEVWIWQDDKDDHPESLTCPVLVSAERIRKFVLAEARATTAERERERLVERAEYWERQFETLRVDLAWTPSEQAAEIQRLLGTLSDAAVTLTGLREDRDRLQRELDAALAQCARLSKNADEDYQIIKALRQAIVDNGGIIPTP